MELFLTDLLKKIVEKPDACSVVLTEDDYALSLAISADQSDCGRIIGKKGKTINALRTLVYLYLTTHAAKDSAQQHKKIIMNIAN